ncbi:MAG: hypothetical protein WCG25_07575 [bacterium]
MIYFICLSNRLSIINFFSHFVSHHFIWFLMFFHHCSFTHQIDTDDELVPCST